MLTRWEWPVQTVHSFVATRVASHSVAVHVVYCPSHADKEETPLGDSQHATTAAAAAVAAAVEEEEEEEEEEDGFYLFRLPVAPNCDCGYCTAPLVLTPSPSIELSGQSDGGHLRSGGSTGPV